MASVQDLYSGIIKPGGGMFDGTGGAGVYDGILPGATGAPSGELTTRSVKTVKIDPYTGQPVVPAYQPGMLGRGQPVPMGSSYLTAAEKALLERQIAQSKTLQAGYDATGKSIVTPQTTLAGMFGRGITPQVQQTAAIPLPRARPGWAPSTMDLAAIGKWEQPGQIGPGLDDLLGYVKGAPVNPAAAAAADFGSGGQSLAPLFDPAPTTTGPAGAGPTGVGTNGYTYVNGENVGYSTEEKAKREALGQAIGERNRKSAGTTRNVFGDNNAFQPRSVQNSVRFQTGY